MVTATLERPIKTKNTSTNELINETHNFVINIDIANEKTRPFLDYLNTFKYMGKAKLSALPEGVCIKLETSNKTLCDLILKGIHQHADVKRTHIVAS